MRIVMLDGRVLFTFYKCSQVMEFIDEAYATTHGSSILAIGETDGKRFMRYVNVLDIHKDKTKEVNRYVESVRI